ncbi:MAG: translation initiation factor eIF-5A family protein [Terrestrivirus sp.]|uniref:Translation initiation factor eIF-5A family protein n=1 Tax=Terrestrivirus sp. TaxID=2487775 RepID=A0A3G4ZR42_9VIRU|nr:MAG: translation initiation factor eIF-5A family protein [Terrestrivirus sp.]
MDKSDLIDILPANLIKKGTYMLADNIVCKVDEYHTAKTGKHGSAKMLIKAYELVSGKQKDISISTSDKVEIPIINRKEYLLMGIEDNFMQLLNDKGELIENIKLNNNDVSKKLLESFENKSDEQEVTVSIMHFMNQTLVDDLKMK